MKENISKGWLKPKEVEAEYELSVSTLAKWRMKNRNLPFSKIGKFIKYRRSDIENFLSQNIVEAVESEGA